MLVRLGCQVQEVPRTLTRDVTLLVVIGVVGLTAVTAYATYRILDQGGRDERRSADAVVVMGAAQYDGRPSPVFAARLDHAIDLYREGVAPRLVVTGGKAEGDRVTEAAAARAYAVVRGVASADILLEDEARTTLESIRGVRRIMDAAGLQSAVFVSDRTHMLRVLRMATDAGISAWGSPTPTSPVDSDMLRRAGAVAHELAALGAYFVAGGASAAESSGETTGATDGDS
jgi:uncharacterized SAM-binding protein YcdF (DUF218 family)